MTLYGVTVLCTLLFICKTSLGLSDNDHITLKCIAEKMTNCSVLQFECTKSDDQCCKSHKECGLTKDFVNEVLGNILCVLNSEMKCTFHISHMRHLAKNNTCKKMEIRKGEDRNEYHCKFSVSDDKCLMKTEIEELYTCMPKEKNKTRSEKVEGDTTPPACTDTCNELPWQIAFALAPALALALGIYFVVMVKRNNSDREANTNDGQVNIPLNNRQS
ncbi:uncharacterized protein LOC130429180 isoform X2 [Triplophysa dalaica]|uniref:uncharacterized protein LOC130429180 isoform X2 n=1 Tax=Triplophysa dalaica TaxID=1582913 RepID=UPI0024DFF569|nr:uncharacterized protein LOC130429180 isoform X2 [Triplophysa dalaica]